MTRDPVCGMNIEERLAEGTSTYKGKTYYFCAKSCKEKFWCVPILGAAL